VIKRCPELVEDVPKDDPPLMVYFRDVLRCGDYALPIRVVLEPRNMRGLLHLWVPENGVLKVLEVILGPFHFQAQAV
jgi:hypothetical protein